MVACTPGQKLGLASEYTCGRGTYALSSNIYSSILGTMRIVPAPAAPGQSPPPLPTIEVISVHSNAAAAVLPQMEDTVTARVTKVNPQMATVAIMCIGGTLLAEEFKGTIRKRDVRSFDIDNVEIYKSFRPGDIIRAKVVSNQPVVSLKAGWLVACVFVRSFLFCWFFLSVCRMCRIASFLRVFVFALRR